MNNPKILVVGDLMMDVYVRGRILRQSPEAPVPVILEETRESRVGGAANTAIAARQLGAEVRVFGILGQDTPGDAIRGEFQGQGIEGTYVLRGRTTVKERIIVNDQPFARLDTEDIHVDPQYSDSEVQNLCADVLWADAIIVSDYNKGVINRKLFELLDGYPRIFLDTKPANKDSYIWDMVYCLKPNEKELFELSPARTAQESARKLSSSLNKPVVATLGNRGCIVAAGRGLKTLPPRMADPFRDAIGAGDVFMAALTVFSYSHPLVEAAEYAQIAASISCEHSGTYCPQRSEVEVIHG